MPNLSLSMINPLNSSRFSILNFGSSCVGWYKVPANYTDVATIPSPTFLNGDFATDTTWLKDGADNQWTIPGNNTAVISGLQSANRTLYQTTFAVGDTYTIRFTINSITPNGSNGIRVQIGSGNISSHYITAGTYEISGVCTTSVAFGFIASAYVTATISNVQIVLHTAPYITLRASPLANGDFKSSTGWTCESSWSIDTTAGTASCDGNQATWNKLYQASILVVGDTYRLTYTIVSISGGSLMPTCGSGAGGFFTARSAPGTYTETKVCAKNTTLYFQAPAGVACTISNVSLQPMHVSRLTDLSGYNHNLLQTTAASQPVYSETSGPNSKPAITWNGSSHSLKAASFTLAQPTLALGVLKNTQTGTQYLWDGNSSNTFSNAWSLENNFYLYCGASLKTAAPNVASSATWYMYETLGNSTASGLALNGNDRTTGNAGTASASGFTLGSNGAGTAGYAQITFSELVLFNRDLTTSERAATVSYLNKWGVF